MRHSAPAAQWQQPGPRSRQQRQGTALMKQQQQQHIKALKLMV
jgi:hypothetical protein